jgi:hypothetical protein
MEIVYSAKTSKREGNARNHTLLRTTEPLACQIEQWFPLVLADRGSFFPPPNFQPAHQSPICFNLAPFIRN